MHQFRINCQLELGEAKLKASATWTKCHVESIPPHALDCSSGSRGISAKNSEENVGSTGVFGHVVLEVVGLMS